MAPIRVKWDPEILAGGFHPSSIFDEVVYNTTAPVTPSMGDQDVAVTASPAVNITAGLNALVRDVVERVVALAVNTTTSVTTTTTTPFLTTTTSTVTTTTITTTKRAVERATWQPEVVSVQVKLLLFLASYN